MNPTRRTFVAGLGTVAATGLATSAVLGQTPTPTPTPKTLKIVAVSCSPRKGKTTATALQAALDAAKAVNAVIEVELIELAGLNIPVFDPGGGSAGDFAKVAPKLSAPAVAGIIIGTPVYFSGMSSLCKAFLDHCGGFRRNGFALRDKVGAAVAVGGVRNGGQELAVQAILMTLLCHDMILVGDGKPTAHQGGTLVNDGNDSLTEDTFGLATAKGVGKRVAEVALRVAAPAK